MLIYVICPSNLTSKCIENFILLLPMELKVQILTFATENTDMAFGQHDVRSAIMVPQICEYGWYSQHSHTRGVKIPPLATYCNINIL